MMRKSRSRSFSCFFSVGKRSGKDDGSSTICAKITARAAAKGRRNARRSGDPDPYQVEHDTLQAAIRDNKPLNNAYYGAESTMTAVLGRMATYSGKEIKWEEALNSKVQHMPAIVTAETEAPVKPNAEGLYPIAIPGQKVEGVEII